MDVRLNSEDKTNLKRLGRKIKTAREAMHLSQEKLAENTGLNRRTISRIENADVNPRCSTLLRILSQLHIPQHDFFYMGSEDKENRPRSIQIGLEEYDQEDLVRLKRLIKFLYLFMKDLD